MKLLTFLLIVFVSLISAVPDARSATAPEFTTCVNPKGQVVAKYTTGTHGIVGSDESFEGSDAVYKLSEDALTQCFCSSSGAGIQTDWWKVSSLTQNEIDLLESQGWIYIPNGALWGLDAEPYLASNSNFGCYGGSDRDDNNSSCCSPTTDIPSPGGNNGSGGVLGAAIGRAGSVLGLASTGNTKLLHSIFFISLLAFTLSLFFKLRERKLSK